MLRIFLSVIFLLIGTALSFGMPAYPHAVKLENGAHIYLRGDEFNKWGLSEAGYTILPKDNDWVYAKQSITGFAEPTDILVKKNIDDTLKSYLNSLPLGIPVKPVRNIEQSLSSRKTRSANVTKVEGNRKALIILMAFADLSFKKDPKDFENLFNEIGYRDDGAMGSVRDYFLWSSYGQLNFTCDIIGPFTAANEMKYYGKNLGVNGQDKNTYRLFEEALDFALQSVDLTEYDSNNDGYIDNFHIIFAGYGEEAGAKSDAIWSHEMTFPAIERGNIKIDRYSCAPELRGNSGNGISRIGPHCHEMGHALGAMDYYDVDYSNNGEYPGTGDWDIMASGSWNNEGITPPDFNPYVKIFDFGWNQAQMLKEGYNDLLPSGENKDQIFMISTPINADFYLIENRRQDCFDAGIPGNGLLIFHIGPDINSRKTTNSINNQFPQQCYVVCASADAPYPTSNSSSYGEINYDGCPYPGTTNNNEFTDHSLPASLCFDGTPSGVSLIEIEEIEDGVIRLYNGTPPMPKYILTEDFETEVWKTLWTQNEEHWKVSQADTNYNEFLTRGFSNNSPIIHDTSYLYSKYSTSFNNKITKYWIKTPELKFEKGKTYELSLDYYNSPQIVSSASNVNKLNIYCETLNEERVLLTSLFDTHNEWLKANIKIPENVFEEPVLLIFEGESKSAGYICIDNIQLQEKYQSGVKDLIREDSNYRISIKSNTLTIDMNCKTDYLAYDLMGQLVSKGHLDEGLNFINLPKGIFIIHFSNETLSGLKVNIR